MRAFFILLFCATVFGTSVKAVTITAVLIGDWAVPTTWDLGRAPQCGDTVVIPAGVIVTLAVTEDYSSCTQPLYVDVKGQLAYALDTKLVLPCGSKLFVNPGAWMWSVLGSDQTQLVICSNIEWNATQGNVSGPELYPKVPVVPLAVELLYFNAEQAHRGIRVSWFTVTELKSHYFRLEKSYDAFTFKETANIAAAGTSSESHSYEFIDEDVLEGDVYYRLTEVDIEGKETTYGVIHVKMLKRYFAVYPNPSDGEITIRTDEKASSFVILDAAGREIHSLAPDGSKNIVRVKLETGSYFIRFKETGQVCKVVIY